MEQPLSQNEQEPENKAIKPTLGKQSDGTYTRPELWYWQTHRTRSHF